ncbi:hypothetical protein BX616_009552, partial [Lobosporangium transversale]
REFRAGCAIMDVLNAVESVQVNLRGLLTQKNKNKGKGNGDENAKSLKGTRQSPE